MKHKNFNIQLPAIKVSLKLYQLCVNSASIVRRRHGENRSKCWRCSYEVPMKFLSSSYEVPMEIGGKWEVVKYHFYPKKSDKNIIGVLERQLKSIKHQLRTIFITTISDNYIQQLLTITFLGTKIRAEALQKCIKIN